MVDEQLIQPRVLRGKDGSVAVENLTDQGLQRDLYDLVRIGPHLADMLDPPRTALPSDTLHSEFQQIGWVELVDTTGRGRRPGRLRYGICPVCHQTRHLLKSGGMGRHGFLRPGGGMVQRECAGQGMAPLERVPPPEDPRYHYRTVNNPTALDAEELHRRAELLAEAEVARLRAMHGIPPGGIDSNDWETT